MLEVPFASVFKPTEATEMTLDKVGFLFGKSAQEHITNAKNRKGNISIQDAIMVKLAGKKPWNLDVAVSLVSAFKCTIKAVNQEYSIVLDRMSDVGKSNYNKLSFSQFDFAYQLFKIDNERKMIQLRYEATMKEVDYQVKKAKMLDEFSK